MMTKEELSRATTCYLVERDGSRWEVLDVEFHAGRAWVTARALSDQTWGERSERSNGDAAAGEGGIGSDGGSGGDGSPPRVFDTVLRQGAEIEWHFPDGDRVRVRARDDGDELTWERERETPSRRRSFFRDEFLA